MRFFFDNCISPKYVGALRALTNAQDVRLVHLQDLFPEGTDDVEWIRELSAGRGWVVVSGDTRITRSTPERAAWRESGLTAFFFDDSWQNCRFWVQATEVLRWWPDIVERARDYPTGRGFKLPMRGKEMKEIYHAR